MEEDFRYQLEAEKKEASAKGEEGGGATYTDPSDGTVYEWDAEKRAWFPKVQQDFPHKNFYVFQIDSTFLANYHASYGFYQSDEKEAEKVEETVPNQTEPIQSKVNAIVVLILSSNYY